MSAFPFTASFASFLALLSFLAFFPCFLPFAFLSSSSSDEFRSCLLEIVSGTR